MCLSPFPLCLYNPVPSHVHPGSLHLLWLKGISPPSPNATVTNCRYVSRTLSLRVEPCSLSAEPVLCWQICMFPIIRVSTEWVLSIPVLLKEWLSWLAEGGRIAICLMHVAVYPHETSSALVSCWNGPVCKEESFPLGVPQHLPCWDYGLLGCNTSRLQLLLGAGCLTGWSLKLAQ